MKSSPEHAITEDDYNKAMTLIPPGTQDRATLISAYMHNVAMTRVATELGGISIELRELKEKVPQPNDWPHL